MNERSLPRILIISAGYGEGHNSAAKGLAEALKGVAHVRVTDVCQEAMPKTFKLTRSGYLWMISRVPWLWKIFYQVSDRVDMSRGGAGPLAPIERKLESLMKEWQPDVLVSTYMVYPYMLDRIAKRRAKRVPYMTVVTDSIVINKSWLCCNSDLWCVTDLWTCEEMERRGVPSGKIRVTGFPVSPHLSEAVKGGSGDSWKPGEAFRVLYFPQGKPAGAADDLDAIFKAGDDVRVTCILGRRFRAVYPHIREMRKRYGSRLLIRGWTRRIPEYLASHHLVVGKAGGATVHEVLAAGRPMLVNYLLPGQEEGNCLLLERLNAGEYVPHSSGLTKALSALMCDGGSLWNERRESLKCASMTGGASAIAGFALQLAAERGK